MPCAVAGVNGEDGLRVHRRYGLIAATAATVKVPPTSAVRDEVKRAVRSPFGLEDRLLAAAGDQLRGANHAVRTDLAHPQLRAIPRHVWVVPLQPSQLLAVRAEAGIGVKVGA